MNVYAPARQAAWNKVGKRSLQFPSRPAIVSTFTVCGPMEGKGPLGRNFDTVMPDAFYGEKRWEKTESKMLRESITHCISRAGLCESDIDAIITGDLLSQCIGSSFAARDISIPHLGVYSACASFAEGLIIASMSYEGGFFERAVVGVSSHHETAERQFRFPTELGVQRPPSAQWTATIAASVLVGDGKAQTGTDGEPPIYIRGATVGEVIEMGSKDPFDMGTAMAPAAVDTISRHFHDFGMNPKEYDAVITGDLGYVGNQIAADLLESKGYAVRSRLFDCGLILYDRTSQDVHAGGSGAACSAGVFCAHIAHKMRSGEWQRVLLAPTGSLHSPTSYKQGEAIPAICHAVLFEAV